jgi:hypothetical protein
MPTGSYSQLSWEIRNQSLALENMGLNNLPEESESSRPTPATPKLTEPFDNLGSSYLSSAMGPQQSSLSVLLEQKNDVSQVQPAHPSIHHPDSDDEDNYNETTSLLPASTVSGTVTPIRKRNSGETLISSSTGTITPFAQMREDLEEGRQNRSRRSSGTCATCVWNRLSEVTTALPAVVVGLMLNLLDAISYGMTTVHFSVL